MTFEDALDETPLGETPLQLQGKPYLPGYVFRVPASASAGKPISELSPDDQEKVRAGSVEYIGAVAGVSKSKGAFFFLKYPGHPLDIDKPVRLRDRFVLPANPAYWPNHIKALCARTISQPGSASLWEWLIGIYSLKVEDGVWKSPFVPPSDAQVSPEGPASSPVAAPPAPPAARSPAGSPSPT